MRPYPVTSFSVPEISAPAEYSTPRSGRSVNFAADARHRPDNKVYTFDLTLKGTLSAFKLAGQLFCESNTSPINLSADYQFPLTYKDGTSSATQVTVLWTEVSGNATNTDVVAKSCIATGMSWSCAPDAEGGQWQITLNMMTAYQPAYVNYDLSSGGTVTNDTDAVKNFFDLTTTTVTAGSAEDIQLMAFNMDASRTVERVHYKESTNYDPYGYAMTGAIDVTGSMTVKRDAESDGLVSRFKDNSSVKIDLEESSGFSLIVREAFLNDVAIDNGGAFYTNTLPFTATAKDFGDALDEIFKLTIS